MFLRSLFYERTVLRHLERVRQLSVEVQTDIAARVSNFIEQARTVSDEQLERFAQAAVKSSSVPQLGQVGHGPRMGCTCDLRGMV